MNKLSTHPAPVERRISGWKTGHYDGKELTRTAGIPEERYEAYKLPSRIGDKLVYPVKDGEK